MCLLCPLGVLYVLSLSLYLVCSLDHKQSKSYIYPQKQNKRLWNIRLLDYYICMLVKS